MLWPGWRRCRGETPAGGSQTACPPCPLLRLRRPLPRPPRRRAPRPCPAAGRAPRPAGAPAAGCTGWWRPGRGRRPQHPHLCTQERAGCGQGLGAPQPARAAPCRRSNRRHARRHAATAAAGPPTCVAPLLLALLALLVLHLTVQVLAGWLRLIARAAAGAGVGQRRRGGWRLWRVLRAGRQVCAGRGRGGGRSCGWWVCGRAGVRGEQQRAEARSRRTACRKAGGWRKAGVQGEALPGGLPAEKALGSGDLLLPLGLPGCGVSRSVAAPGSSAGEQGACSGEQGAGAARAPGRGRAWACGVQLRRPSAVHGPAAAPGGPARSRRRPTRQRRRDGRRPGRLDVE